ncbi:diacylglycerol kinase catalytic domain protein [Gemella haemolysans]|uniref:Diacylglycerol kinase catalytic domain protein n=1 Tax=Gemella haemolysans TaxID=1379 RepID=A0A133ZSH3_9BACL|nr:diacylglycerol kinase family protein [Gemella haemolysans]KXB58394.1 diacylglycerol kinase catalytic domain protein [Gemella haemolysans]
MIEIIVNSRSKKSLNELNKIERVLQGKKLPYRVLRTSKKTNAKDLMNEIHGAELIVIGGDGTINEVINNYHGKEIIYLAYGSGNDLARSIEFKKDIEISRLLESKRFIEYDVGVVNDRKFCSGFDIGFNADIIKRVNGSKLKKYLGKYIYLLQGVIGILMLKKYKAKISWDSGEITTDKLYLLNAMIQPYEGGGIKFAPNATGQDGKLHIMIMENMSLVTFVYNYLCLLLKKHNKMRKVKQITTDRLAIKTNQRYFQIDGELINNTEQLNVGCISKFYKLKRMEKNEKRFK